MTDVNIKRSDKLAADQAMVDGTQKFLAKLAPLPVGSRMMTPDEIVQIFQDRLATGKAVLAAEAARTAAIKADKDKRQSTAVFERSFRRMVQGMFSQSPDTLAIFGLKPLKAAKKTVETKATAVAKNKATRVARNTQGKKQKSKIKGTPPADKIGATSTPATAAPKPSP